MTKANELAIRRVVIGGQTYDKPFDRGCAACTSPWLAQIDELLAEGYTFRALQDYLKDRRPPAPAAEVLSGHVAHLADPQRKMRLDAEESAALHGGGEGSSLIGLPEANQAVIRRGFQLLAAGRLDITARDFMAAMKLQAQMDRAEQGTAVEAAAWQGAFMEFFEIVRRHLSAAGWKAFTADVYASPQIRGVLAGSPPALPPEAM